MKIKCIVPGCKHVAKSAPGLSAHIRVAHDDLWKGSIKNTQTFLNGGEVAELPRKKRRYRRKAAGGKKPARRLQRAAIDDELKFCPRCACNLEAVRMALSFAAGNR